MNYCSRWLWALMLAVLAAPALQAKEELVTLPKRDTVQLTIYNSVDLTLVQETRTLSFKKGNNRLQFSWAQTLIDPTSVEFRALTQGDKLEVLDTSYPAESNEMLIWTISAEADVSARVEISYFTSGLTWSAQYVGMLAADEASMTLTAYVSVTNRSGEEYENAQVRLVVGSINLVEKINQLAGGERERYKRDAEGEMRRATRESAGKKDIVKEGLSEYYIYTVGGTETIPHGWSKRLESFVQAGVPVSTVYTYDARKYGAGLTKLLTFKNNVEHKLGKEPLPEGTVRLYRTMGGNALSYVGEVATPYIAKNDEIKVNAGADAEVTMKLTRLGLEKKDLAFRRWGGRAEDQSLEGWTTVEDFKLEVKNFRNKDVRFEINLVFGGDFDFDSSAEASKVDFQTRRFAQELKAGSSTQIAFKLTTRNGTNVKNR
ncbi:hypothetical protein EDM80_08285 [bacterium]|nr:MAG: hypothetical protein EDM80_08285 [bacterium]RIK60850.1 MAG: hypothetical protein DCC64_14035 [Planctomycetota bacterium]